MFNDGLLESGISTVVNIANRNLLQQPLNCSVNSGSFFVESGSIPVGGGSILVGRGVILMRRGSILVKRDGFLVRIDRKCG